METTGFIFDIKKFAIHDGPGIRTTVFFKGCPLRCWWCHNPEGYETDPQRIHNEVFGRKTTVNKIISDIEKDTIFYEESGGGATFSGGEPFHQPDFLYSLLAACKEKNIHTTVDTSGYTSIEHIKKCAPLIDLFLYDLKFINDKSNTQYTGVSNKKILDNLNYLCRKEHQVIIRIPIIPYITDTEENLSQLAEYIVSLHTIKKVDILAFHNTGRDKFQKLGLEYKMKDTIPPGNEHMLQIKEFFETYGLVVKIGG